MTLVADHLPFAHWCVRRIVGAHPVGVDPQDLSQAGMIGLMKAARNYDPRRGSFRTFAWHHVSRCIHLTLSDSDQIRIPCGIGGAKRRRLRDLLRPRRLESFDWEIPDPRATDPAEMSAAAERAAAIRRAVALLPKRQRELVRLRYLDSNLQFNEIGRRWGLTKQRVEQINQQALARLRQLLTEFAF